jgi:DNA-binding GntR family transcriptional regulator
MSEDSVTFDRFAAEPPSVMPEEAAADEGSSCAWRIRALIEAGVENGRIRVDGRLPSERWLSERLRVHRSTVQKALARIAAQGTIYRLNRSGWYLSPPRFRYEPTADCSFTQAVLDQGRIPGSALVSKTLCSAGDDLAAQLEVGVGTAVAIVKRVRLIDGRPVFVENSHIVHARCPDLLDHIDDEVSLAAVYLHRYGFELRRRRIVMHPTALDNPDAGLLKVAPGTPGLFLKRLSGDHTGQAVSLDIEHWRHDALHIEVTVRSRLDGTDRLPASTPESLDRTM